MGSGFSFSITDEQLPAVSTAASLSLRLCSLFSGLSNRQHLFLNPPGELTDQHRLLLRCLKRELRQPLLGTGNSMVVQCFVIDGKVVIHGVVSQNVPGNRADFLV